MHGSSALRGVGLEVLRRLRPNLAFEIRHIFLIPAGIAGHFGLAHCHLTTSNKKDTYSISSRKALSHRAT